MKAVERILVPIDFSLHASEALKVAADVGRHYEASLTLLHIWEPELFSVPGSYMLHDPAQLPGLLALVNERLAEAQHEVQALGVMQVAIELKQGKPAARIVGVAEEGHFDLIVMGTHGRTGITRLLLGSVAEHVVRNAPCSVMVVRGERLQRERSVPR